MIICAMYAMYCTPIAPFLPHYFPQVNTSHPVIREARKNGDTIFVISTLYRSERCNIEVSFSEKIDDSAHVTAQASAACTPLLGATAGGSLEDSKASVKGVELCLKGVVSGYKC